MLYIMWYSHPISTNNNKRRHVTEIWREVVHNIDQPGGDLWHTLSLQERVA